MVLEPDRAVTEVSRAPKLLGRPAEAPPPLARVRDSEQIRSLHEQWAGRSSHPSSAPRPTSVVKAARAWAGRSPLLGRGRANRRLLGSLIRATDAVAAHGDQVADRLGHQEALLQEITEAFGEDITRLRAEVIQLRRLIAEAEGLPRG